MSRLETLIERAREAAEGRGHTMKRFTRVYTAPLNFLAEPTVAESECNECGMEVRVDTNPAPNGIDIGGEAVALNCVDSGPFQIFPVTTSTLARLDEIAEAQKRLTSRVPTHPRR